MNPYEDEDTVDELPAPPRKDIAPADREALALAARALGARFEEVDGEGYGNLHFEDGSVTYSWNPLVHSDDAFGLVVKLQLDVLHGYNQVAVNDQNVVLVDYVEYGPDPVDDARRAVTRAAAEIGKSMGQQ